MRNSDNKTNSKLNTILIIVFVVVFIILILFSFGYFNSSKFPTEFIDSNEEAKRKHKRLEALIEKQLATKTKIEKKFKFVFLWVRIGLILMWFGLLGILYYFNIVKNFSEALTYSQVSIIIILIFNFITFGTIGSLKNFVASIKIKTENMVYGKYINLDEKIEINKQELSKIESEIKK